MSFIFQKIKSAFRPVKNWGPIDVTLNLKYKDYMNHVNK